nr:expressed protein [Hymenolepis microstoma]
MMTGRASWILLLLVAHIFSSANPSQAAPIEDTNPQEGAIEEDADTSSSSSKDVELTAEMPPVGDSALLNELTPARRQTPQFQATHIIAGGDNSEPPDVIS